MRRSQLFIPLKRWFFSTDDRGQQVARIASFIVILISCLVLLGWVLNFSPLKTMLIPGSGNMRANAALGLLLSGISLNLLTRHRFNVRIIQACTIVTGAIGLLTLLQYAFGWNFGIDELLFRDPFPNPSTLPPGRMSVPAAINLSSISVALGLLSVPEKINDRDTSRTRMNRTAIAQSLALIVGVIALQALIARVFGLPSSSWLGSAKTTMGAHTALASGVLAIGVLALRSKSGWMQILLDDSIGSLVARRSIPVLIVTPLLLGWLILQGHEANWYDANFSISLMSIAFVVTTIALIVRGAGWLNQVDYDRKRSSDRLRSSEERLQLAQAVTQTGIWEWNSQTGHSLLSESCSLLFGVPLNETDGSTWISRIHLEDLPQVQRVMQEFDTTGTAEIEYRYHHPERGLIWIYSRAASASDNPHIMRGISFDITDRKQAELDRALDQETIRQQLAEIEAIYHTAPIGLGILDRDLRFVRLNQQLAEINGLSIEAHIGRTVREIVPDLADEVEPLFRRVLETGEPLLNLEITGETSAQPGVQRTWIENWYPLRDAAGEIIGINAVVQEITHRKRAELALRDKEQQLQQLSDSMPQFVWTSNAQGELEYVNRQWCDYAGLTLEQCLDPSILATYHHAEEVEQVFAQWRTALETKQPFEFEGRLRSREETVIAQPSSQSVRGEVRAREMASKAEMP